MSDLMGLVNTYTSMRGTTFAFNNELSPGGRISELSTSLKG